MFCGTWVEDAKCGAQWQCQSTTPCCLRHLIWAFWFFDDWRKGCQARRNLPAWMRSNFELSSHAGDATQGKAIIGWKLQKCRPVQRKRDYACAQFCLVLLIDGFGSEAVKIRFTVDCLHIALWICYERVSTCWPVFVDLKQMILTFCTLLWMQFEHQHFKGGLETAALPCLTGSKSFSLPCPQPDCSVRHVWEKWEINDGDEIVGGQERGFSLVTDSSSCCCFVDSCSVCVLQLSSFPIFSVSYRLPLPRSDRLCAYIHTHTHTCIHPNLHAYFVTTGTCIPLCP